MKFIVIALFVFFTNSLASPMISKDTRAMSDELEEALEQLKEHMPCGFPEQGIPPLAPFKQDYLEASYEHFLFSILGSIIDLRVDGLNNFDTREVDFSIFSLTAKFDINFNDIKFDGDYSTHLILVHILKITGTGKLDLRLQDLRIRGSAQLGARGSGLYMKNFEIVVSLGKIKSNISGLLGGGLLGKIANKCIEAFVPFFIKNQEELISDTIYDIVVPTANDFLGELTIKDLIEIITKPKEPAKCTPNEDIRFIV